MTGIRFVLKGLSDTFENLVYFLLMTLAWWLAIAIFPFAPAATMALFVHADPRHGSSSDRLTWSETLHYIRTNFIKGWLLALATIPFLGLFAFNFFYYGNSTNFLGILTPLWFVLFFFGFGTTATAFSHAALTELPIKRSLRTALLMTGARLPVVIPMLLFLVAVNLFGAFLVIPLAMFIPMTNAAVFNRFVLASLKINIVDPLEPTPERLAEGKEPRRFFPGRRKH